MRRGEYGVQFVAFVIVLQKLGDNLAVGIARKLDALRDKFRFKLGKIFDYAVVHDGEHAVLRHVRVRVYVARHAVRRPARVSYAHRSVRGFAAVCFFVESFNLAHGFHDANRTAVGNGYAARIVSAIFEAFQPFKQYGRGLLAARVTYNSAHR